MIKITEQSRELTPVEKYLMTIAPSIKVVKDIEDNAVIPVKAWCEFEDVKDTGEVVELLSILTPNGEAYSCQSATFKRSFHDILEIVGDMDFSIIKISGKTNAGRPFVNCTLDPTSVQ